MRKHKFGNKIAFACLFVAMFFSEAIVGSISIMMGRITDYGLEGNIDKLLEASVWVFSGIALFILARVVERSMKKRYLLKSMVDIKQDYVTEMLNRSPLFFRNRNKASIVSNLTNDMDRLEEQYYMNLIELISYIIAIIISTLILTSIQWYFIFIIIALGSLFAYLANKSSQPIKKDEEKKSDALVQYTGFVDETLNGFEVIKQHGLQDKREQEFIKIADSLKQKQYNIEKRTTLVDAFNNVVQFTIIIILLISGIFVSNELGLKAGSLFVIVNTFGNIIWPLQNLPATITKLTAISTIFDELNKTLKEEIELGDINVEDFNEIVFDNVSLGYDAAILENVNFEIKANEKVLIVGPSGEGKSTLLKSILKEIDPLVGTIKTNGHVIDKLKNESYFNLFSKVEQHGFIFSDTLQRNINLLGNEDVSQYLNEVNLQMLDEKMLLLNDGGNISTGQRARLMLARALFFDKEILISDEVFAALDKSIGEALEKDMLKHKHTLINVSHVIYKDNLDAYDKYLIVSDKKVKVSYNKQDVLDRMLETSAVIQ